MIAMQQKALCRSLKFNDCCFQRTAHANANHLKHATTRHRR